MTARDRLIIVAVLTVAALGAFWFVGLAPKRKEASQLQSQIDVASQQLADVQQKAAQARKAKARYSEDYAEVATLGKAVPKNDALPSLLYQLQAASRGSRIDFSSLKVTSGGAPAAAAPAAASAAVAKSGDAAAPAASDSSSGSGSTATPSDSTSQGATASGGTPSTTTPAPATQAAAAALPPGAAIGSAGFPTMPFTFVFSGTFFDMEHFLRDVQRFVRVNGERVDVRGRLLSIDAFGLTAGPGGFPNVKANITATAYLRAPGDDVVASDAAGASSPSAASADSAGTGSAATASAGASQ
jgi:hypothetical protein